MSDDPTRDVFHKQLAALNTQIVEKGALLEFDEGEDGVFRGVDESIMGPDFMRLYQGMTQTGYAHGWL